MSTKPDLRALRVLPYVTAAMIVITHLAAVALCILAIRMVVHSDTQAYNFIGIFISYSTSFKFIIVIAMFVCLYRLSGVTKWFYYSWICCIIYIVAGLFTQIVAWLSTITGENIAVSSISFILSLFPDASVLFAVYALLRGAEDIFIHIDKMDGRREASRAGNMWIFVETALLSSYYLLFIVCALGLKIFKFGKGKTPVVLAAPAYVFTVFLGLSIIAYVFAAVKVTGTVRRTCYEYYLYNYNSGVGL